MDTHKISSADFLWISSAAGVDFLPDFLQRGREWLERGVLRLPVATSSPPAHPSTGQQLESSTGPQSRSDSRTGHTVLTIVCCDERRKTTKIQEMTLTESQVVPRSPCAPTEMEVPWFARPPVYTEEEVEMYPLFASEPLNLIVKKRSRKSPASRDCPSLPFDPRRWSRADVCLWVEFTCLSHHLPLPAIERFLMNGKAVCLMSPAMFSNRVPLGGKLLYKDFQIRLAKAVSFHKGL